VLASDAAIFVGRSDYLICYICISVKSPGTYDSNVYENYTALMRGLGLELLHMLCEGLGLPSDYFDGDQSAGDMILSVIRYPPCPTPDVTLGLPPHCDRNLITLVLSGSVPGLQVLYKGDWIMVKPIRNSFVINFGLHLEVQ